MIKRLQKSMDEKDKGFTLVELLVVIVIIGILAGIAIPLFLSQRQKGVEAGIKSDLKSLATVMETQYVDNGTYAGAVMDDFTATDENVVVVADADVEGFCLDGSSPKADNAWHYDSTAGGLLEDSCP